MAVYDATIAAWGSKYAYNRPRPSDLDFSMRPVVDVPPSPSYPSEYSAAATAAAMVLASLFPDKADAYQAMAEEAGLSRVFAGVQFPSDHTAGKEIGRYVAQKVIERMATDGYARTWQGIVPLGRCQWLGTNPGNAAATGWRTFLLNSPGEFRPAAPPDCESPEMQAEVAVVRGYQRTFQSDQKAYYWQSPEGRETKPFILAERWMFEDQLDATAQAAIAQGPATKAVYLKSAAHPLLLLMPPTPPDALVSDTKLNYDTVSKFLVDAAKKMPGAEYGFRPMPDVRSFAQLVGHVAEARYTGCSVVRGEEYKPRDIEKSLATKAELVLALERAVAFCQEN